MIALGFAQSRYMINQFRDVPNQQISEYQKAAPGAPRKFENLDTF